MAKEVQPWSPFRELDRFRRDFDELFDRFLGGRMGLGTWQAMTPPALESFVQNDHLTIRADLPGIDPNDVEVTVSGKTLALRGKREQKHEDKGRDYVHREVAYGSFERQVELPAGVNAADIKASYHNGVLELTAPIPKEAAARKVPIQIESSGTKSKG
jgi:HSP20 family protein